VLGSGVGAQSTAPGPAENAAPWWEQWCDIYEIIVPSQPWYDLCFLKTFLQELSPNLA